MQFGAGGVPLPSQEAKWATPTARDWKDGASPSVEAPTNGLLGRQAPRWPTPNVPNGGRCLSAEDVALKGMAEGRKKQVDLGSAARHYGSSQNGINGKGGEFERPSAGTPSLFTMEARGDLPSRQDPTTSTDGESSSPHTPTPSRRSLNPVFVEMLMGLPPHWTDVSTIESIASARVETASSLNKPSLLSVSSGSVRTVHSIEEVEAAGGYQIIYADPCWPYEQRGRGAAENHYRTMSVEEIAALPVGRIAAKNAVLFIWGTWPNLFECKQVIEGWGFRYKTLGFNWVKATKNGKTAWGGGSYARANSEFCLMAVRGNMSAISHSVHQLVEEWEDREDLALRVPVGRHSQKPAVVRDRIVELFGDLPRIELFARERVAGWDAFGDDPALGGPDVDLMPRTNKEDTGRSNVVHVQFENTHTNDSNTQDNEDEEQGEDTMGQMPESVRKRIAKSRANAGGTNIRHGEYILMYWKSSYDRMNSGNCHINEFVVVQAKKIVVVEGETQKEVEPNQVGTMCSYVINYDGKGKLSADGNSKAIILGMFGLEEKPDDEKQIAELDQALADLTADSQPAKGMLIKLTTYAKEVRSRPGNFITGMKWACVDRPGTGENTVEKAAARVAQFQAMQAQQQQAQQNQQLSA